MDHQLITMDAWKEDQEKNNPLAEEDQELERERARDPLRPLVLLLIQQARRELEEEDRKKKERSAEAAQRSDGERP